MLKKLLFLSTIAFSSISNAGLISGNLTLGLEWTDLNMTNVSLDSTMYKDEIASNALQFFTNDLNFSIYLDNGPQNNPLYNSGVFKTHDKRTGATISSLAGSFTYSDDSFRASFYTHGFNCLQGTGILLPIYDSHNDAHLGFDSGCYKTVTFYDLTLGKLNPTTDLHYNNLQGTTRATEFNNTPTNLKITKTFYDKSKYLPYRDFDELDDALGSLSVNHNFFSQQHVSSSVNITYVPETNALALFVIGLIGLNFSKRKKIKKV